MKYRNYIIVFALLALPLQVHADVGKIVGPLSCGIYEQSAKPLVEKDLKTQNSDKSRYTMEAVTKSGRKLTVLVHNVSIDMAGERNNVTVLLEGKPFAKTSHQDVPLYLEVHVDGEKYRIICVRMDLQPAGDTSREERVRSNLGLAR
jgi:hypothetical protein